MEKHELIGMAAGPPGLDSWLGVGHVSELLDEPGWSMVLIQKGE